MTLHSIARTDSQPESSILNILIKNLTLLLVLLGDGAPGLSSSIVAQSTRSTADEMHGARNTFSDDSAPAADTVRAASMPREDIERFFVEFFDEFV